jgi:RNA polymerase sigma-70 factor (ECF subfamily)
MSEPHELHDELHRHAGALRRIARDLVRDPHLAEDAAQDTVRAALAAENLQPGPLGGWLQRTLENFVRQWRRGERRRNARHAALPAPSAEPTPFEVLDRRETLAAVTEAVLALEEPYQTAVFLRYFADLPPRAIAQRTGQNLATVKSRLHRGLGLLRERLDRRCGDRGQWRLALATAFGLPLGLATAGLTVTTGAWIMSTAVKTTAAICLVGAGALLLHSLTQEPPPVAQAATPTTAPGIAATAELATPSRAETTQREAADAAPAASLAWLDHPYLHELEVLVVDALGMPVAGRKLRLAPPQCSLAEADTATDEHGRVVLAWPARQLAGEVVLEDERGTLRRIPVQHGQRTFLVVGGRARRSTNVVLGEVLSRRVQAQPGGKPLTLSFTASSEALFAHGEPGLGMRAGLHPFARFGTLGPRPNRTGAEPAGPDLVIALDGAGFQLSERIQGKMVATASPQRPPASIAGTVFGDDGKPVAKTAVLLLAAGPQPLQSTETDDQGNFRFDGVAEGTFTVRAGGGSTGLASMPVAITTGTTPATLNLQRGSCVRGTLRDAERRPAAGATVSWQAADGSGWDSTTSDEHGQFVLANLPATGGTVLVWPKGAGALQVLVTRAVPNDSGDLAWTLPVADGALQLVVANDAQGSRPTAEVRIWQLDTGLGAIVPTPEAGQPWRLANLPAGFYRVEVHTASGGWQAFDQVWVDGKGSSEIGTVQPEEPGLVAFDLRALDGAVPPPTVEIYQVRRDLDVRIGCGELPPQGELALPPGDYTVAWRNGDGPVRFERFTAMARTPAAVTLKH